MKRETIDELNELSEKYFGTKSKWRKMVDKGATVPVYQTIEIEEKDSEGKISLNKKRVPVMQGKSQVMETRRLTVEQVLKDLRQIDAAVKKSMEEKKKAEEQRQLEEKVHSDLAGVSG